MLMVRQSIVKILSAASISDCVALQAVFGLGAITCVVSILRLPALYAVSKTNDTTWDNPLAAIWSSLEVNSGILCSCLPTLKGCVSRYFPKFFPSNTGSNHRTPPIELSRHAKSNMCRISANCSQMSKASGRMGRFLRSDIKDAEEGSSDTMSESQQTPPTSPGIHIQVTTIVEQEEERAEEIQRSESESVRGLVPAAPFERT